MPLMNEDDPHRQTQQRQEGDTGRSAVLRQMVVGAFPDEKSLLADYGVSTVARLAQWLLAAQRQGWSTKRSWKRLNEQVVGRLTRRCGSSNVICLSPFLP